MESLKHCLKPALAAEPLSSVAASKRSSSSDGRALAFGFVYIAMRTCPYDYSCVVCRRALVDEDRSACSQTKLHMQLHLSLGSGETDWTAVDVDATQACTDAHRHIHIHTRVRWSGGENTHGRVHV